ncbi:transcription-repair coupling factor [Candidatus Galacturonibacter soehngenii]|uniref:Transcription-repair-coupling factor n=1 Tax=Candidatus Galacturonatibacter soehngenii TaxID=2307010 RepID=A0A7V7QI81_9FIRM|nr:transcription-repair coupling factor [Candidatus Galacturonibacter soehngenii]KAB1435896.1 transcription-repair coupling factor [Candidatus Galacturonibacter soehngenii]
MNALISPLTQMNEFNEIKTALQKESGLIQVSGCIDSQKTHFMYALSREFKNKIIVASNELKAKEIYEDYKSFDKQVMLYPAKDLIFYNADIHGNLIAKQRIHVIKEIMKEEGVTIILTLDGLMDYLVPLKAVKNSLIQIDQDSSIDIESLKARLIGLGYEKVPQVEASGQFAIRGGIIDIFSLTEENPYRIELWDEEVDSIRSFDVESQRSIEQLEHIVIYPAAEIVLDSNRVLEGIKKIEAEAKPYIEKLRKEMKTEEAFRIKSAVEEVKEQLLELGGLGTKGIDSYIKYFYEDAATFLDYFESNDTILFLDEPNRILEKGEAVEQEFRESMIHRIEKGYILPGQMDILLDHKQIVARISKMRGLALCTLEGKQQEFKIGNRYGITAKSVNPYNSSFELLVKDLQGWKKAGYKVILLSASKTRAMRLAQDLRDYELNAFYSEDLDKEIQNGEIMTAFGNVHKGYEYPLIKLVIISETDIFGAEKKKKKKRKVYEGQKIQSFSELKVGDYVVHENHGLGIYKGIEKIEVDKVAKDYIKIEYASGGNLYILATQLELIQKYAGSDAKKPKLNKLGSQEWNKTKTRVKGAVKEIAKDLVELYALRQEKEGYIYSSDTVWQREFEEMFPYEETDDQLLAIEAVKKDMESPKIMDRLVCGDVGYGKTEIAIRAAFKAVQDGKQVVYLVPTTILAQQHYNTFVLRMKDFPIRVDLMSRFRTQSEMKKTVEDLKKGFVDIVVGTHRVLSKDIIFKDLGLLIIDEEQRFGVAHKEKIKQLKKNVDVLTLTATPIPRTLHMSLIGIRDMSVLEEPPMDRMPIQTFVMEYNDEMVREAIQRELAREGQVYYVYNRVNNIDEITNSIAALVPDANVAFAHGQMNEHELEKIMYNFINGEIDVLVSTTIIETGLDISNVNTIIIHDADNLGLSQLYQLRGRVGRSNRTSYAFLMYKRNKMLKEIAEKRLHAIREFTELGSGFKIAMRDLEIRGAGNLLGAQQSGHMEAVGYDLYCKMLNEAVKSLKNADIEEDKFDTTIDIDIDAFIPEKYIASEFQKLDIYKRIASIENEEECDDMLEELIDRFGDPPRSVTNLLAVAHIKALATSVFVTEVSQKGDAIKFTMYEKAKVNPSKIPSLLDKYKNTMKFTVDTNPYFTYIPIKSKEKPDTIGLVKNILSDIKTLIDE